MARGDKLVAHLSHQYLLQSKNYISPCGCQRADFLFSMKPNRVRVKNGGPDRTRTYDPRLIKAVL